MTPVGALATGRALDAYMTEAMTLSAWIDRQFQELHGPSTRNANDCSTSCEDPTQGATDFRGPVRHWEQRVRLVGRWPRSPALTALEPTALPPSNVAMGKFLLRHSSVGR